MPDIVDNLHRQWAEDNADFERKTAPRFSGESYRVVAPRRLARPDSFKKGGKVRKSGLALVHKGERIISKRAATVLSVKRRRRKKARKMNVLF